MTRQGRGGSAGVLRKRRMASPSSSTAAADRIPIDGSDGRQQTEPQDAGFCIR
ncbi:hypothetical protein BS78_K279200 [Paspalum vaginatum]|uniref:Uncharacterized protein n=1 Tax=Paspalum vaginatum TaxID=158149 RepID=A0A9W7XAS1_9POAL|nr:hypothetical protein BS78_K279200 [Paspalum vaginatum]